MNRLYGAMGVKHARDLHALVQTMDFAFLRLLVMGLCVVAIILYIYYMPSFRLPRLAYSLSENQPYEQLFIDEVAYHLASLESGMTGLEQNSRSVKRMLLAQYGVGTAAADAKERELRENTMEPLKSHFGIS